MDITKKKILKAILLIILIIIFLFLLFFTLGARKTYSKYNKDIKSSSITETAKPIFVVDGESNILIDGITDKNYTFEVKNYDSTGASEVDLDYYIEIVNNSSADLTFELTKDGKRVALNNNKTSKISLSSLTKQDDSYSLKIKYKNNTAITNDISGNVQIKVEAVQAEK